MSSFYISKSIINTVLKGGIKNGRSILSSTGFSIKTLNFTFASIIIEKRYSRLITNRRLYAYIIINLVVNTTKAT